MASESEKVFGNDGEFFPVQIDQHSPFRDSGYYDSALDFNSKLPFDPKSSAVQGTDNISGKHIENMADTVGKDHGQPEELKKKRTVPTAHITADRRDPLMFKANEPDNLASPVSVASLSDSEYQSGKESLENTGSDSPASEGMPETSVDTGEMFQAESATKEASAYDVNNPTHIDKAADNCVIS